MDQKWEELYQAALAVAHPHAISSHIEVGSVGAAVLTAAGHVYTGICIDTACSLGMCAERNALSSMLTAGENRVVRVCAVYKDGTVMPPCGACREFMMQLGEDAATTLVLVSKEKAVPLGELMPWAW